MDVQIVEGTKFRLRLAEGYLRCVWYEGAEAGIEDAEEVLGDIERLAAGQRLPLLVDLRSMKTLDRAARQCFGATTALSRVALFVDSPLSRMVANFYLALSRPSVPTQMFTSEADAVTWLTRTA